MLRSHRNLGAGSACHDCDQPDTFFGMRIGIIAPARIRTAKTSLQRSSRVTTTLKPVSQRWPTYRYGLFTELGTIHEATGPMTPTCNRP